MKGMMSNSGTMRVVCWLCAVLMVSICLSEMCVAQTLEESDEPDSLQVEPQAPDIYETVNPVQSLSPVVAPDDPPADEEGNGSAPVYRRWWVWALVAVAIGVLVGLAGGGSDKKADEDLPGFPDPPER